MNSGEIKFWIFFIRRYADVFIPIYFCNFLLAVYFSSFIYLLEMSDRINDHNNSDPKRLTIK